MPAFEIREAAATLTLALPDSLGWAINSLGIATALPQGEGLWSVSSVSKVGVVAVGEHELYIKPKLPIPRLFFLMGYSRSPNYWRNDDVSLSADEHLVSSIVGSFIRQVKQATVQGLLQDYKTVQESEPMVRGKLNIPAQIGRRAGLPLPAEVTYDDYTVDIAENRMLLAATRKLLTVPRLAETDRQSLRKLELKFEGVGLAWPTVFPPIRFTRLNAHYAPAVLLAEIILKGGSLEQQVGTVSASSFLFDMWEVFEDFVSVALREAMASHGGSVDLQYRGKHLDVGGVVPLRPDIVWRRDQDVLAVLDAKYKAERNGRFPNADLYQMLAYCTRFKMQAGHLVYAKGECDETIYEIHGTDVRIFTHSLDLEAQPLELLGQIGRLAAKVVKHSNIKAE
ncbi:5-methylcytosine-specific restriction enzyme subunit McrC [Pseudarthrobacter sp. W1I19]|uniref:McrC family protein n=1 Tax=Pseudarthrobacter sp. W1I19 TaxID=3042288 RepID=UPI00277DA711|nr:restriction endonuclease [Pseudarthrobacter sp. W1I19]MDQ0924570.1 5-methylcytosine-specific restriction enzyme subunit McrC [Pseudarthrobacter sp. W1I19]